MDRPGLGRGVWGLVKALRVTVLGELAGDQEGVAPGGDGCSQQGAGGGVGGLSPPAGQSVHQVGAPCRISTRYAHTAAPGPDLLPHLRPPSIQAMIHRAG